MRPLFVSLSALLMTACVSGAPPETNLTADMPAETRIAAFDETSHRWLEEVEGEDALAWVTAQNDRTLAELQADPRYGAYEADALDVLNSSERIPYGTVRDGYVYNFWQDETHVRGLWRRTTLAGYATDAPEWETILDVDKLAAEEGANWVYKGADCRRPEAGGGWRCLVSLSNGG